MSHNSRQAIFIGLIACYVALNGWLPFRAMGHAQEHSHHTAETHATALCSWLCAGGQVVQASEPILGSKTQLVEVLKLSTPSVSPAILNLSPLSRGPPYSLGI